MKKNKLLLFSLIFGTLGLLLVFVKAIWLKIKNN